MSTQRQPKGIPVGGQFAANSHDEAGSSLVDHDEQGRPVIPDDPKATLFEKTYIEDHTDLYILEDGARRAATPEEVSEYEFAISTLHEDETEVEEYLRHNALAQHLGVSMDEIERSEGEEYYGLPMYRYGGEEWTIGTEEQADAAARENVKENVWAVNADFLERGTGIDAGALRVIQTSMYENANEPLQKIIDATWDNGLDGYADDIIEEDGRANGLSHYDGEEQHQAVQLGDNGHDFFMYRYQ